MPSLVELGEKYYRVNRIVIFGPPDDCWRWIVGDRVLGQPMNPCCEPAPAIQAKTRLMDTLRNALTVPIDV